jgi:putative phosphoesterase
VQTHNIGIISDTHGLLRPEAVKALRDVEQIIHAGDVGRPEILQELRTIAPVVAVRGNADKGDWAHRLPMTEVVEIDETLIYVIHDLATLDLDPKAAQFGAVINGHSHQPSIEWKKDVLYLNPGSAGPRRFDLPVSMALLCVTGNQIEAELVKLSV